MSRQRADPMRDQALALAGVAQFSLYAHELAADGRDSPARLEAAKHAIFTTDPDVVMDIYGERSQISDGEAYLRQQFAGRQPDSRAAMIARYIGQVLKLSGNLRKNQAALSRLGEAIGQAGAADPEQVPTILDAAYRDNISPIKPQIMLHGHPSYLRNEAIQARVRVQLMAAVRCAVLWRQCGGGFVSLIFRRKALLAGLDARTS